MANLSMPPEFTRRIGSNVTANGIAAAGQHTPVDATAGAITLTLPSGPRYGASLSVEKVDSTTNTVTINGSIRGNANASVTLMAQYESMEFRADNAGSWRPIANHLPKSYVTGQVTTAVNNLVAGAPAALDTLKEIADAFGDDPNFLAGLLTDSGLAAKLNAGTGPTAAALSATYAPLASPHLTGTPTVNGNQVASISDAIFAALVYGG